MGKKQHYIPRFILQNFADENGLVWCLNKQTGKVFATTPENIGYENHLYSIGNEKDEAIETFFSKIEADAAPVIEKIIETKQLPDSEEDRVRLFRFLASFNLRYPNLISALNNQANLMKVAEKKIKADPALASAEFPAFKESFKTLIAEKNRFYVSILKGILDWEYNTLIGKFNIGLLIIENNEFIISNEYKYFIVYSASEERQEVRAYMYYPIAPKFCIILGDKELPERDRVENWSFRSFKDFPGIEAFNRDIAVKEKRFLFGSNGTALNKAFAAAQAFSTRQRQFKKWVDSLQSGVSLFSIY